MSVFDQYRSQAESVITQAGSDLAVLRESVTGTDRYGKDETAFMPAGTIRAVVFYGSRRRELLSGSEGRWRQEEPRMMVSKDADVQEDDYVVVHERNFRVDTITEFPTHLEAQLFAVTE